MSATDPITDAQRRAIFALAAQRGLTIDDLRPLTPQRSIGRLTRAQAAHLLDYLAGRSPADVGRSPADVGRAPADAGRSPADAGRTPADVTGPPSDPVAAPGTAHTAPRAAPARRPRPHPGVIRLISQEQLRYVEDLGQQLMQHYRWSRADYIAWCSRRHLSDGRPITELSTSRDGAEVIQLLTHVLRQARAADTAAREARRAAPPTPATTSAAHRRPRFTPHGGPSHAWTHDHALT